MSTLFNETIALLLVALSMCSLNSVVFMYLLKGI